MANKKTTFYIDEEVLRDIRISAARQGKRDSQVVEEALRRYTWVGIADQVSRRANLSEEEATKLACDELHAMRAERDGE